MVDNSVEQKDLRILVGQNYKVWREREKNRADKAKREREERSRIKRQHFFQIGALIALSFAILAMGGIIPAMGLTVGAFIAFSAAQLGVSLFAAYRIAKSKKRLTWANARTTMFEFLPSVFASGFAFIAWTHFAEMMHGISFGPFFQYVAGTFAANPIGFTVVLGISAAGVAYQAYKKPTKLNMLQATLSIGLFGSVGTSLLASMIVAPPIVAGILTVSWPIALVFAAGAAAVMIGRKYREVTLEAFNKKIKKLRDELDTLIKKVTDREVVGLKDTHKLDRLNENIQKLQKMLKGAIFLPLPTKNRQKVLVSLKKDLDQFRAELQVRLLKQDLQEGFVSKNLKEDLRKGEDLVKRAAEVRDNLEKRITVKKSPLLTERLKHIEIASFNEKRLSLAIEIHTNVPNLDDHYSKIKIIKTQLEELQTQANSSASLETLNRIKSGWQVRQTKVTEETNELRNSFKKPIEAIKLIRNELSQLKTQQASKIFSEVEAKLQHAERQLNQDQSELSGLEKTISTMQDTFEYALKQKKAEFQSPENLSQRRLPPSPPSPK